MSLSRVYWFLPSLPRRAGGRPDFRVAGLLVEVSLAPVLGVFGAVGVGAGGFDAAFVGEAVSLGSSSPSHKSHKISKAAVII